MAACLGWAWLRFGSLGDAWRYAAGARVFVERPLVVLPLGRVDETQAAEVVVRNLTSRPVKLLGATVSCDCVSTEGVPAEIPAGGALRLRLKVHLDARMSGPFGQTGTYFTDHPAAPNLRVAIRGHVLNPEAKGGPPKTASR